jgi:DNA segregation ATPase FtsK/SpoIIIE, S-DNA-T family
MEQPEKHEKLKMELKGLAIGALGLFLLIALLSFNASDPSSNSYSSESGVRNFGGRLGAETADLFLMIFGVASYLIPCSLIYFAYRLLRFKEFNWRYYKGIAFLGLLVSVSALFAFNLEFTVFLGQKVPTGGIVGFKTTDLLRKYLGISGALLLLLPMLVASIMVLSRFSLVLFADWWIGSLGEKWGRFRERRALNRELFDKEPKIQEQGVPVIKPM